MKASLRTKFIIFITFAIVAFDFIFLLTSVNLYNKDKASYIYENTYSFNRSLSQLLSKHLDQIRLLSNIDFLHMENVTLPKSLAIENIWIFDSQKKKFVFDLNKASASKKSLDQATIEFLRQVPEEAHLKISDKGVELIYQRKLSNHEFLIVTSNVSSFVNNFQQLGLYSLYFFDHNNQLLFDLKSKAEGEHISKEEMVKITSSTDLNEGAREITVGDQGFIMASSQTADKLIKIVTTIPKSVAFAASTNLIYQNMALAVIFIGISIVIILFLAKLITNPLVELTKVAEEASLGNYDVQVKVTGQDEIGILVLAFNKMFSEIKNYIEQLKDKFRIENEIKVAKAVQEQYIPKEDFKNHNIHVAGHYASASECSGDWWGYKVHEGVTYLFISDVTGHGLPAALLTAAVNSCCASIDFQIKNSQKLLSPSEILTIINHVIFNSSDNLMLTMFVAMIDHKEKKIHYANASHEFPFMMDGSGQVSSLLAEPGFRLGDRADSVFEDSVREYNTSDILFFYTDGLVENVNKANKPFGSRTLLKLLRSEIKDPVQFRNLIRSQFDQFTAGAQANDDVTYFFAELS